MSQYRLGTATATNGSATITGQGTSWLSEVAGGDWFILSGSALAQDKQVYIVAGVSSDTSLQLTVPYAGAPYSANAYAIHRDFLPDGRAQIFDTDAETAGIVNKNNALTPSTSGLGTAAYKDVQESSTDATAGRVMLTGAGGLLGGGVLPPNNDCNDIVSGGLYDCDSSTLNTALGGGTLLHITGESGSQMSQDFTTTTKSPTQKFTRSYNTIDAGWGGWQELYTEANFQPLVADGLRVRRRMRNVSGITHGNGLLVAGADLKTTYLTAGGVIAEFYTPSGTWAQTTGASLGNLEYGEYTRES